MKPVPPPDLWAQMDAIHAQDGFGKIYKEVPSGCFTLPEYAQRYNISRSSAGDRVAKMVESGKVEFVGVTNRYQKIFRPAP